MKAIILQKGWGKTYQLIKASASSGDTIVCHSFAESARIAQIAQEMQIVIPLPMTYTEFMHREYYPGEISGFLLDNADMFLQTLTSVKINAITLSP